jgi:hypothetical protein
VVKRESEGESLKLLQQETPFIYFSPVVLIELLKHWKRKSLLGEAAFEKVVNYSPFRVPSPQEVALVIFGLKSAIFAACRKIRRRCYEKREENFCRESPTLWLYSVVSSPAPAIKTTLGVVKYRARSGF